MQIVIAALLLICTAHAEQADIPRKAERLNRVVKIMTGPKTCDGCGFAAGQDVAPDAWEQCLREVCGTSWNERNQAIQTRLSPANMERTPGEFSKLIDDAIRSETELEAAALEFSLKALKSEKQLSDPAAKWAGNLTQALLNQNLIVVNDRQEVDILETSKRFSDAQVGPGEKGMAVLAFNTWTASERTLPELFTGDFEPIASWEGARLQAEVGRALQYIDDTSANINQSLGTKLSQITPTLAERRRLRDQFRDELPDPQSMQRLAEVYRRVHGLNAIINSPEFKRMAQKSELKRISTGHLEKRRALVKKQEAGAELAKAACAASLTLSQLLPEANDIKRFKKFEEPASRKRFLNLARRFLSRHSAEKLDRLASAKLRSPTSHEQYLKQMKMGLEAFTRENQAQIGTLARNEGTLADVAVTLALASEPYFAGRATRSLCESDWPPIDEDQTFLNGDELRLSGDAASGRPGSLFAAGHGYSKLVAEIIQSDPDISSETKSWFDGVRSCLNQAVDQPSEKNVATLFADLMGSSFAGDATRLFCGMIHKEERSLTLKNWSPHDPDRPGYLFRALHARVVRGEGIPEVCKAALAEKGENPFDRNCLKEVQGAKRD